MHGRDGRIGDDQQVERGEIDAGPAASQAADRPATACRDRLGQRRDLGPDRVIGGGDAEPCPASPIGAVIAEKCESGLAAQPVAPAPVERRGVVFQPKPARRSRNLHPTAAPFSMDRRHIVQAGHRPTQAEAEFEAQIEVLVAVDERLVETAQSEIIGAPAHHQRGRHRRETGRRHLDLGIAGARHGVIGDETALTWMPAEPHADVVGAARADGRTPLAEQLDADDAAGFLHCGDHPADHVFTEFDIVVEQQQKFAGGPLGGAIARIGEAVIRPAGDERDRQAPLPGRDDPPRTVRAAVIDDDDLDRRVAVDAMEARQQRFEQRRAVAAENDRTDQRRALGMAHRRAQGVGERPQRSACR